MGEEDKMGQPIEMEIREWESPQNNSGPQSHLDRVTHRLTQNGKVPSNPLSQNTHQKVVKKLNK